MADALYLPPFSPPHPHYAARLRQVFLLGLGAAVGFVGATCGVIALSGVVG